MGITYEAESRHRVKQYDAQDDFGADPGSWDDQASVDVAEGDDVRDMPVDVAEGDAVRDMSSDTPTQGKSAIINAIDDTLLHSNFLSWERSRSRMRIVLSPCYTCMCRLLDQVGMASIGSRPNVTMRFRRTFHHNTVTFSDDKWRVKDKWFEASTYCGECKPSIGLVYHYLYPTVNQQTAHNGSSTYAEITRGGVFKMIHVISEQFKQISPQGNASTFRAIDLGGGYLTCLAHIAQVIPGEYAAVEYCEDRCWAFANSYGRLLSDYSDALCNTKIAYASMNIFDLDYYDCDLVYTFDEAFPPALWGKIVRTFVASPRCKLLITFKPAKATPGYKDWQRYMKDLGLREACPCLHLSKKGGESSNAMFMIRSEDHEYNPSDTDWAKGEQFYGDMTDAKHASMDGRMTRNPSSTFWDLSAKKFWGGITIVKEAVADLKAQADAVKSDAKMKRR
jgi:hypothetical protein